MNVTDETRNVSRIADILQAGDNVEVIGSHGSGRTYVIDRACERLSMLGWRVLPMKGIPHMRDRALSAASFAGIVPFDEPRLPVAMQAGVDKVQELARHGRCVLVVDDWDDVDESSRGLVLAAARFVGVPVLLSRLVGMNIRRGSLGLTESLREAAYVVELKPLSYDELGTIIGAEFDGPVESSLLGRVYAKSGGVIGLAKSLAVAAVRDGRIVSVDGVWKAVGDLWSPSLRGILRRHLDMLGEPELTALETLSLAGLLDLATARDLTDASVLERLEDMTFIQLHATATRTLVALSPPLIVEYFRHESLAVRRTRIAERIRERLGDSGAPADVLPVSSVAGEDAVFVRLVQEHLRARLLVARREWERSRSLDVAVRLAQMLADEGILREEIDELISSAEGLSGNDETRAQWAVLLARYEAFVAGDLNGALEMLAVEQEHSRGGYGALLTAAAAELNYHLGVISPELAASLALEEDVPGTARAAQLLMRAQIETALGRFRESERSIKRLAYTKDGPSESDLVPLMAWNQLGLGETDRALALAREGFEDARGSLKTERLLECAFVLGICLFTEGRYREVEDMLSSVLPLGNAPDFPVQTHLALVCLGAVTAIRRGRRATMERYSQQLDDVAITRGPLPGAEVRWVDMQQHAAVHDVARAAEIAWRTAEDTWKRGARFAGAVAYLISLEIDPSRERIERARPRLESIEGQFISSHFAYIDAAERDDPGAIEATIDGLVGAGRYGLALTAIRRTQDLYAALGDARSAEVFRAREEDLLSRIPEGSGDVARYLTAKIRLTDREREVARKILAGRSNPQIASSLVVSVRTVESHLRHIMRKAGVEGRPELLAALQRMNLDR